MATRTVKFLGNAFSADGSDVSVIVNFNDVEVFNGTVSATTGEMPVPSTDGGVELFTFDLDSSVSGRVPMSISVANGDLQFETLTANFSAIAEGGDPSTSICPLAYVTDDEKVKHNLVVEGAGIDVSSTAGDFVVNIQNGETATLNYFIDAELIQVPA